MLFAIEFIKCRYSFLALEEMINPKEKNDKLKEYFAKEEEVILAFLFGSKSQNRMRSFSDWDIGVYFKPSEYLEIEQDRKYKDEDKIWSDLIDILETDNVDFVVLNRARPVLVYNVLRTGIPLKIENKGLYLDLLCKVSYEAMDWWDFVSDYWKISQKAYSLHPEAKSRVLEILRFLEKEFKDIDEIRKISFKDYSGDSFKRRNVERWVENLVMSAINICEIVLACEGREIPQSYKDVLKVFVAIFVDETIAEDFSEFAKLRNIVVHEYLDIKWKRIKNFIQNAENLYPKFIAKIKQMLE